MKGNTAPPPPKAGRNDRRPNILRFCSDQQRRDTVAALGNSHIATPAVVRLCAGGVAVTRAYTQRPICAPARATFLAGRHPASHHVYRNGNAWFPQHDKLVTRIFADAGYDCGRAEARSAEIPPRRHDGHRQRRSAALRRLLMKPPPKRASLASPRGGSRSLSGGRAGTGIPR